MQNQYRVPVVYCHWYGKSLYVFIGHADDAAKEIDENFIAARTDEYNSCGVWGAIAHLRSSCGAVYTFGD